MHLPCLTKNPLLVHHLETILAILQGPEDYNALATSLSDIVKEASELQSIEIKGKEHNIEYFLGGDLKFLAIVCGIEAANAIEVCLYLVQVCQR